jgi:hypothetical protein
MLRAALALTLALAAADIDFISTWRAPGSEPLDFAGRTVAAVLVTDDVQLRVSSEEALARELTARGSRGVPAYRIIPKEELANPEKARAWFERAGVHGLVILRIVATDTTKGYSSAVWASGDYTNAWDFWGTSWASVYPLGKAREEKTLTVETLLYDLTKGAPIWAGVSRATDPADPQSYIEELTREVVKRLAKDGLVSARPR